LELWDIARARRYGATEVLFLRRTAVPAELAPAE